MPPVQYSVFFIGLLCAYGVYTESRRVLLVLEFIHRGDWALSILVVGILRPCWSGESSKNIIIYYNKGRA